MASSEPHRSGYSRRFFWLTVFIVLLFGGYAAAWFYAAGRLDEEVGAALAAVNRGDRTVECARREVRGFPFRIGVFCEAVAFRDGARGVAASAGNLRSLAQVYQPTRVIAELDGPLVAQVPGLGALRIDWKALRSSARLAAPLPSLMSIEAQELSVQRAPDGGGDPTALFDAARAEGHLRPNGKDLDWAGRVDALSVDPAVAGRPLPPVDGSVDLTLSNGAELLRDLPRSLRGQAIEIRALEIASGDGAITASGPASVGADGLIDADLTLKVRNPTTIAARLAETFPEKRREIEQVAAGMTLLGGDLTLPLRVVDGEATLGFIQLGRIEPLP